MAAKIAFVTVRLPDPVTVPDPARMTVLPLPVLVAIPLLPGVLLTVATLGADELQWTELVRFWAVPSVNVPTAVNAWFNPKGIAAVAGLTAIETTEAGVTVSSVDPSIPPRVAVIVAVPVAREVPIALELTVATTLLLEPQVAEVVRSWVLPSVNVPVAVNSCVVPNAMDGPDGFTVIETSVAVLTVRVVESEMEPDVAEMLELPLAALVAKPWLPAALLMVATEPSDESQWTEPVMPCALPSLKVPVAANCSVVPRGMVWIAGVMAMETNVAGVTVKVDEPPMPAAAALIVVWPVDALVASPLALAVATDGADELQVADVVRSSVLPSA
jgi:hypothetical protein